MADEPLIVAPKSNLQEMAEMGITLDEVVALAAHASSKFGIVLGTLPDTQQVILLEAVFQGAKFIARKK